jgi:hypothetical protein
VLVANLSATVDAFSFQGKMALPHPLTLITWFLSWFRTVASKIKSQRCIFRKETFHFSDTAPMKLIRYLEVANK